MESRAIRGTPAASQWWNKAVVGIVGTTMVLAATCAMAQPADAAKAPPPGGRPVVLVAERQSLDKMVVDPRDAALAKAVGMLPARLRELRTEIPGMQQVPQALVDFVLTGLSRPGRVALTFDGEDASGGLFGAGVVASLSTADETQANSMQGAMAALMRMGEMPVKPVKSSMIPTMMEAGMPVVGTFRYGPRKAADGWRYEIHAGTHALPDEVFAALPGPARAGFEPVIRARFDPAPLTSLVDVGRAAAGEDPGFERAMATLKQVGLLGPDALKWEYQFGYLEDRSIGFSITRGMKKFATAVGSSPQALSAADLACIPADAIMANAFTFDLDQAVHALREMKDNVPEMADGMEQFQQMTGVDPIKDLLGNLGTCGGMYMADSTGGGGLMSLVAFASLKDGKAFEAAANKIITAANSALAAPTKGYVRIRTWVDGSAKFATITFPGMPVPVELTATFTDKHLIVGLSPQAALAAARQATGKGDSGLMGTAAIGAVIPKGKEITQLAFIDTPRTMAWGYQYVLMGASMLANLSRSPVDDSREPGLVMPTFAELKKGSRPLVTFGYYAGDDLVQETHADRSLLASATGTVGAMTPFFPIIAAAVTAAGAQAAEEGQLFGQSGRRVPPPPPPHPVDNDDGGMNSNHD